MRVFAMDSFWYTQLPANAPVHPTSNAFRTDFLRQVAAFYGPNVGVNTTSYASPVYIAEAGAPCVRVKPVPFSTALSSQWAAVPIPAHAKPATGTDAEMTIYQPSTDTIWEFWKAVKDTYGAWTARWGGRMTGASKNPGIWPPRYGTTATGLPFLGGQITSEELTLGEIPHAIGIALVECEKSSILSWPALRGDGANPLSVANRIPQGLRFRFDPAIDAAALKIHPVAKQVVRAGQKYGFVVWDKAGAVVLRCQNPIDKTSAGLPNPYTALFAGTPSYALLKGVPWDRIQFLPADYGKPVFWMPPKP